MNDLSANGAENKLPFNLAKFFSYISLLLILISSVILTLFIGSTMNRSMLESQEEYALLLADNINRQIFATRKTVGQYKVDVAEQRILDINPHAVVHTYKTFYSPDTAEQFDFTLYDYVVDAIDTVTGKLELVEQAEKDEQEAAQRRAMRKLNKKKRK